MQIREIIEILKIDKLAPIHFLKRDSENKYSECKHMSDEEYNDYIAGKWTDEKQYSTETLGIYFPDISIHELYELEIQRNPTNLKRVLDDVSYLFLVKIDERELIFATYVILHEVGHWVNFRNSRMTSLEYSKWDSKYRREVNKYSDEVRNIPDYYPEKAGYAQIAVEMYKEIPSEKAADEYAFENIKESLNLLGIDTIRFD